jgi:biopolymer transport protein ExbD
MIFSIRHEGSPQYVEGVAAAEILEGVKEGLWEPTDEIRGKGDADWTAIEQHPAFAAAMADMEPPPPKHPEDDTRLDFNPLIDVALVLLIFFMLTTTYEELRKEFVPPPGQSTEKQGRVKTEKELKSFTIRVTARQDGDATVFQVEGETIARKDLEAKFKEWIERSGHRKLAMEIDPNVPWSAVVAIQDAAAGAKIDETIRIVRPPRE